MINYKITKFQAWILNKIFRFIVRQSWDHENNIKTVFILIRKAVEDEFTEDNDPTLDSFMLNCFENSQSKYYIKRSLRLKIKEEWG